MSSYEVTDATFEDDVLQRSFQQTVVVDFWAAWCGPCRQLTPVLERLADESSDWVLAKVDVDANPRLSGAFGIQSIPAVKAFRDGKQVGQFMGALPEHQVRKWLEGLGPSEGELTLVVAEESEKAGRLDEAREAYEQALKDEPGLFAARSGLARVDLVLRARDLDAAALTARAEADPGDLEAAMGLADVDAAAGRHEQAFRRLIETIRQTSGDDREKVRRHLLNLFDTLPADDPRVLSSRRDLSMALF
ncbi:MAG TPA: tetratricopeptide repeat protein [Actinomycetota bacterium]|nr:tetratricopeptide repeat protein [Actinomycetota bacterium]